LNEFQKKIYNCFLKNSRKGKPFQPRKDFSDMSEETLTYLTKMELFFQKYSHINIEEYFEAPNCLHPDDKYPNLQYFFTRSAIKTYTVYKNIKEDENPENQFDKIKESICFIGKFCLDNGIELKNYLNFRNGYMYSWINHYREHRINPYSIMELGNFEKILFSLLEEERDMYASNLVEKIDSFKVRYHNSYKTKTFVKTATKKIENFVKENLQNKTSNANIKKYE
jgi:hypothetical protein